MVRVLDRDAGQKDRGSGDENEANKDCDPPLFILTQQLIFFNQLHRLSR